MLTNLLILLQAEGGDAAGDGGFGGFGIQNMVLIGGIILVFYFFMIRPQSKRQKEEKQFREGLKKGDKIITIGGIFGRIVSVENDACLIEVDSGVKLKIDKSALKTATETGGDQKSK